jgi:hypothetical protein
VSYLFEDHERFEADYDDMADDSVEGLFVACFIPNKLRFIEKILLIYYKRIATTESPPTPP